MKLRTAHQRARGWVRSPSDEVCRQCDTPWPCDAAVACEEVEMLNRVIARLLDGWQPFRHSRQWIREDLEQPDEFQPMSDGEAAIIRQHQEKTQ
jgi:hypothetical protein